MFRTDVRFIQGILPLQEGLHRCAETKRGNSARNSSFLLVWKRLEDRGKSDVRTQEGRQPPSCPINTFLQQHLHLSVTFRHICRLETPTYLFTRAILAGKNVETGEEMRTSSAWPRVLICDGRSLSGRFSACQRPRIEECPPAVRKRGPWEGERDTPRYLYFQKI